MKRWLVILFVLVPTSNIPNALAVPLPYTAPWNVAFKGGGADQIAAWGGGLVPPIVHGAIAPGSLNANNFFARAEAVASGVFLGSDAKFASVTFDRPFVLPAGAQYTLTLSAILAGVLDVTDLASDSASVTAGVCIGPVGAPAFLCLNNPAIFSAKDPPTPNGVYNTGLVVAKTKVPIQPGAYEVRGFLGVNSSVILGSFPLGDVSQSNFLFASEEGFQGNGEYDVIPEPATTALVYLGLAIIAFHRYAKGPKLATPTIG